MENNKEDDKANMPRYILDIRLGCAAVRDTKHEDYDKDYRGLYADGGDVVDYKHGYTNNQGWYMKQKDIDYLKNECERLNNGA